MLFLKLLFHIVFAFSRRTKMSINWLWVGLPAQAEWSIGGMHVTSQYPGHTLVTSTEWPKHCSSSISTLLESHENTSNMAKNC